MHKSLVYGLLMAALAGCGKPEPAAPLAPVNAPAPVQSPAPVPEPVPLEDPRIHAEQAALSYLETAKTAAEKRHQVALSTCERHPEPEDCIASAEEGLQSDLRAARVEFDARMSAAHETQ